MNLTSSTSQKLNLIAESGYPIAWDGCHKIYFLLGQNLEEAEEAINLGFDIYSSSEVHRMYEDSCPLRFVSRWVYNNDDFDHEWNISQFEDEENN